MNTKLAAVTFKAISMFHIYCSPSGKSTYNKPFLTKVTFRFRHTLLLLIFSTSISVNAQELPKNHFESFMVRVTNQHRNYIDLTLQELKKTEEGSLKEANLNIQLTSYYWNANLMDSARYYRSKAVAYWQETTITEEKLDAYGQFLFTITPVARVSKESMDLVDSVAKYLKNEVDLKFLAVRRFVLTSFYDDRSVYFKRYNDLMEMSDLDVDMEAYAKLNFVKKAIEPEHPDSAFQMYQEIVSLPIKDLQTRLGTRLYLVESLIRKDKFIAAEKRLSEMEKIVAGESLEQTTFATLYHIAKQEFFIQVHQYDSAAYYGLESIKVLEGLKTNSVGERYLLLGEVYEKDGNFPKAIEVTKKGLSLVYENAFYNRVYGGLNLLTFLCSSYDQMDDQEQRKIILDEIGMLLSENETISLQVGSRSLSDLLKAVKARYLTYRGQYLIAERMFEEALASANKTAPNREPYMYLYAAELYLKTKKFDEAIFHATKELNLPNIQMINIIRSHEVIVEAYIGQGRSKEALAEFDKIKKLREEESVLQTRYLLSQSEYKQELESQKVLNASLESEQLVKSQLIKKQQWIIIIIGASIAIIGAFVLRLKSLNRKNLNLLSVVEKEGAELQFTNAELGDTIAELQGNQSNNQQLLDNLSDRLAKTFNGIKGLKSFIPELGKLNNEQEKYLRRLSDLVDEEESALKDLISLNSILGNHKIDIRRVIVSDVLSSIEEKMQSSLKLRQTSLTIDIKERLIFLADKELIEMSIFSLLQHSLQQELSDKKLSLEVNSQDGLRVILAFKSPPRAQEEIDKWLKPSSIDQKNYLSKLAQLKDLMDGDLTYIIMGDIHKVTLKLNLIELTSADNKTSEIDQLEIDTIYDKVQKYLLVDGGLANPELSLSSLSNELGIPNRKLSFVINKRDKTNFSKFLSKLRIEKVKEVLDAGGHAHLNIAGIGYEAGFNSKSTFFSSFKEFVGCTPKEYLNSLDQIAS